MADPIQYAPTDDTLPAYFPKVATDNTGQVALVTSLLVAASSLIDRYTDRPPGYFAAIGATAGTKRKINIIVDAEGLLTDSAVRLEVTAAGLAGSPLALTIDAAFGVDDSESIAAAFVAALATVPAFDDFLTFVVGEDGISLDLEPKILAAVDPTFAASIEGVGEGTGIVATNSTVAEAGSYSPATIRRMRGRGENFLRVGRYVPGTATIDGFTTSDFYEAENGWLFAKDTAAESNGPATYDDIDVPIRNRPARTFAADAVYLVSARWGFAETPGDIVTACQLIAQHIYDRGQGTFGQITPSGFVIERDIPPTVRLILDNWKRKEFELN